MHIKIVVLFLLAGMLIFACKTPQKSAGQAGARPANFEPHRPLFHFTPPQQWMNDPNGMVYYEGEYHLFYQYHPHSNVWGPMHWGHAVSPDMVHWEHLPVALYPDSLGYIFSGSVVVDWNNTSGFGRDGKPPLVAIFTHHDMSGEKAGRSNFQYQSIAYSNDRGRSWTKYAGNPVIPNTNHIKDFRDPKVIWHEASAQWVMVFAAHDHVQFWGSKDLKKWAHLSDFGKTLGAHGGLWECPDLFPLRVQKSGETKWVLLASINPGSPNGGSGTQYFTGDFDGKTFTADPLSGIPDKENQANWLDYGRDNYAGVTWSDVPRADGRRLFLGWMSNWDYAMKVPTEAWRSAMTIPRSLSLHQTPDGYLLHAHPVAELQQLRTAAIPIKPQDIQGAVRLDSAAIFPQGTCELILEFKADRDADFGVELSNAQNERYRVGFNGITGRFYSDRTHAGKVSFTDNFASKVHTAPRLSNSNTIRMHLYVDRSSAELFADGGATVMTDLFFPNTDFSRIALYSEGGKTTLLRGEAYPLKRAAK